MNKIELLQQETVTFSVFEFGLDMLLCAVAAFILRALYINRSVSLSGKFHIGTVIPILALVTFLVIMVVKSSLALSLGLVGALSVVRFRTPIKEPEELVYLFLSIALGLGYGAHQTVLTTASFVVILIVIWIWLSRKPHNQRNEYNLLVDWDDREVGLPEIIKAILGAENSGDLLKYSSDGKGGSVFVKVLFSNINSVDEIVERIRDLDPSAKVSFYEARPLQ